MCDTLSPLLFEFVLQKAVLTLGIEAGRNDIVGKGTKCINVNSANNEAHPRSATKKKGSFNIGKSRSPFSSLYTLRNVLLFNIYMKPDFCVSKRRPLMYLGCDLFFLEKKQKKLVTFYTPSKILGDLQGSSLTSYMQMEPY